MSLVKEAKYPLVFIFLAALVVRILCVFVFYGEIDTEGAEYARIAQNLLAGHGYSGIATEGTQLFFPPLFPFLIAALSLLTNDAEIAGRSLSVVFGSLLVFPVFFIGRRLFSQSVALGGAALVAFHPYLVFISTGVNCEPTYFAILFAAIYASMRASNNPGFMALSICGLLYGLAYLVRQEALVLMVVALICILAGTKLRHGGNLVQTASRLWLMPVCFLVLAGPYIVWLSWQTGQPRFEAKSPLNIATELRIQSGLTMDEAAYGVGKDLLPQGGWNQPNIDVIRSSKPGAGQVLAMILKKSKDVLRDTSAAVVNNSAFGSPALFAIAFLGLFSRPWRPRTLVDQLHLMALLGLAVVATVFIYYTQPRFYLFVLIVFCIWASAGIFRIFDWAARSASTFGAAAGRRTLVGNVAGVLAVLTIIVPSAGWAGSHFKMARDTRPIRVVASGFAASGDTMRVADTTSPFAFHARAKLVWLPYSDEETALRFLRKNGVTHVVVSEPDDSRPYLKKWMEEGVPNSRDAVPPIVGATSKLRVFKLSPAT